MFSKEESKNRLIIPSSKFLNWEGNDIHYTDEGQGECIIMVHGLGGSFHKYDDVAKNMVKDYRVIRVDIPGMGLSEFKSCNKQTHFIEDYSRFFKFFFEELKIENTYLMGNSFGGMIAWLIATEIPEKIKGLVLISSAGYDLKRILKKASGPLKRPWFQRFLQKGLPKFITNLSLTNHIIDTSKVSEKNQEIHYEILNTEGNLHTLTCLSTTPYFLDSDFIKTINIPTLIIWGKEDNLIPVSHAELFHRDIKNSEVRIYNRCGHIPMLEYPDRIAEDFRNFFQKSNKAQSKPFYPERFT
ncbi:MAG: alpha/beta hydrolase [Chitinophagales bacterium]|nr:alpha/beta hydrolase [Chitinophagales bacterium]